VRSYNKAFFLDTKTTLKAKNALFAVIFNNSLLIFRYILAK